MEFRLNKIDTDLRQKINEATQEGKIHAKKGILINKEKSNENKQQGRKKNKEKEKFYIADYASHSKKISVQAVKIDDVKVEAQKEEASSNLVQYKGQFIDSRR